MKAAIIGISGLTLSGVEAGLIREHPPAGVILFARNVADPAQVAALNASLRALLPPLAVLMVDQEGGRVARLRPPHWRAHPSAATIGALHAREPADGLRAAWLTGALIGLDCQAAGFDTACAPVLDLRHAGAHDIIGDRAFAAAPAAVAALGRAVGEGLRAAGVQPVIKHIPGHGRARADSHMELPTVAATGLDDDFAPFRDLADAGWAMTAHILYTAWDAARPATLSPRVIGSVIREKIGFAGVLVTDDLSMRALSGAPAALAQAALAAGCDLALHCPGLHDENVALLAGCPAATPATLARLDAARRAVLGGETAPPRRCTRG